VLETKHTQRSRHRIGATRRRWLVDRWDASRGSCTCQMPDSVRAGWCGDTHQLRPVYGPKFGRGSGGEGVL